MAAWKFKLQTNAVLFFLTSCESLPLLSNRRFESPVVKASKNLLHCLMLVCFQFYYFYCFHIFPSSFFELLTLQHKLTFNNLLHLRVTLLGPLKMTCSQLWLQKLVGKSAAPAETTGSNPVKVWKFVFKVSLSRLL